VVQQWRHETVVRGTRKRLQNRDTNNKKADLCAVVA
jgi:hypothetical protein